MKHYKSGIVKFYNGMPPGTIQSPTIENFLTTVLLRQTGFVASKMYQYNLKWTSHFTCESFELYRLITKFIRNSLTIKLAWSEANSSIEKATRNTRGRGVLNFWCK